MATGGENLRICSVIDSLLYSHGIPADPRELEATATRRAASCFSSYAHLVCASPSQQHVQTSVCYFQAPIGFTSHQTTSSLASSRRRRHPERAFQLDGQLLPFDIPRLALYSTTRRRLKAVYT
jgi:hypothetical protein